MSALPELLLNLAPHYVLDLHLNLWRRPTRTVLFPPGLPDGTNGTGENNHN